MLQSIFTGILVCVGSCAIACADPSSGSLKRAAGSRLLIGTAVVESELKNTPLTELIAGQFSCLTVGNEMKPDAIQAVKGKFTFERADRIVAFARANGIVVIGHTLLWHQQTPKWFFENERGEPLPREEALYNLRTHIHAVLSHYRGKVKGWDVVNEAVADAGPDVLRDTPARRAIGDDYVLKAFEFAREADPDVELYYNDYNIEMDYKRDRAIQLLRRIKEAGLRIDGVGVQGHWLLGTADAAKIERGLRPFFDLDMNVMITEMDIDPLPRVNSQSADLSATEASGLDPYKAGLPDEIQQNMAKRYGEIFEMLLRHRQVTRITLWGTFDGGTWLDNFPTKGRTNHPLLWDRQLQPKPAKDAVFRALSEAVAAPK